MILDELSGVTALGLVGSAVAVALTTIAVRFVWVFAATYLPLRRRYPRPRSGT